MNEDEPFDIVLNSNNGKAKGVYMQKEKDNIQIKEVVGLSAFQLFFLVISAILVGAAAFGIGFYMTQDKELMNLSKNILINQLDKKYDIGIKNAMSNNPSTSSQDYSNKQTQYYPVNNNENINESTQFPIRQSYILIGKYNTMQEAQKLQNKVQMKAGKLSTIKQNNDGFLVLIGPFESENLARNEKNLIYQKSSVMGSITNEL